MQRFPLYCCLYMNQFGRITGLLSKLTIKKTRPDGSTCLNGSTLP